MNTDYLATLDGEDSGQVRALLVQMVSGEMPPQSIEDPILISGEVVPGYWVLVHWDTAKALGTFHPLVERDRSMSEGQAAEYLANGHEP